VMNFRFFSSFIPILRIVPKEKAASIFSLL
jgi:hypothetical protein